ncbi:MAG: nitroreductase family protein [Spirochaetales bacterium]|nr:nitroreductase family protein [Candidatus Physcosoma equi]
MGKHEVVVDKALCIGCGLCEKDCVSGAIRVVDGKALVNLEGCISCGHCEAICPKNAVCLLGFKEESVSFDKQTRLDPKTLMAAIKTRRTVRVFRKDGVGEEILRDIIEAGRLAPTGGNSQGTGFIVLGTKQEAAEAVAVSMFSGLIKVARKVIPFLRGMEIDSHFFFKGAPLVIVITGDSVNASLAAENMAFMAEAHGLGVLFSGFFTMCVNHNRKVKKILGIKKEKAVTTLVLGYPGVKYQRTAKREEAKLRIL